MTNLFFSEKTVDKAILPLYNGRMEEKINIIRSDSTDPYQNLAAEEYLTRTALPGAPLLFLWQNDPCVVIGKNQSSRAECDLSAMEQDGIPLVRRLSGGGAVWHDRGNLCFSFISHESDHKVAAQLALVAKTCAAFDIDARPTGRNDIEVDGKKISGNAFYTVGHNKCHHGTLLISADTEALAKYLTVSRKKLEAKGIRSVAARVVNLRELNERITVKTFCDALIRQTGGVCISMPDRRLYEKERKRFASREWLIGSDPAFTDQLEIATEKGLFTLWVSVKNGRVADCTVYTDALDPNAAERLQKALIDTDFDEHNMTELIRRYQ